VDNKIEHIAFPETSPKLDDETFIKLRDYICKKTGIYFNERKKYFIEGRLAKRLQMLAIPSFEEYYKILTNGLNEEEFSYVCNIITVNETSFFRNEPQITAFQNRLAVELIEAKRLLGKESLKIWSAACSSGEEPYTIAMVYLEHLKPRYPDLTIEIIGTDINTAVLELAKRGVYTQYSLRSLPEEYLKYFDKQDGTFKIKEEVKNLVHFDYLNLVDKQKMRQMKHFDFIFCANVLIYFHEKAKIQVVNDLYNSLNRGGYLLIGSSEMLHRISTAFKLVGIPKATAYKKE